MQIKKTYYATKGLNAAVLSIIGILALMFLFKSFQVLVPQQSQISLSRIIEKGLEGTTKKLLIQTVPLIDYVFSAEEQATSVEMKYKNSYFNQLFSINFPLIDYVMQYESIEYKTAVEVYPILVEGKREVAVEGLETLKNLPEDTTTVYQAPVENLPRQYTMEQLTNFNFLVNNFYIIDGVKLNQNDFQIETLLSKNLKADLKGEAPKVLIYHTHAQEEFIDSRRDYSDKDAVKHLEEDTVVGVGAELARILEQEYGISVIHHKGVYDLVNGRLDRSKAYTYASAPIKKIIEENPSIQVVIDLHRDGVKEHIRLATTIDGKPTAKIMFFNGYSKQNAYANPHILDNLALSLQMQLRSHEAYPTLARKIYIKPYRYNMHLHPKSILLEVGAQTNTVEEAKNAMIPFAKLLVDTLEGN